LLVISIYCYVSILLVIVKVL